MAAAAAYVAGICLQACLLSSPPATQVQSTMESSKRSTQHSQAVQVQAGWHAHLLIVGAHVEDTGQYLHRVEPCSAHIQIQLACRGKQGRFQLWCLSSHRWTDTAGTGAGKPLARVTASQSLSPAAWND